MTPNHLLGRVVMTANVLGGSVIPFGTLAGGFAIQRSGDVGLVYTVIGAAIFIIPILFSFTALGRAEEYLPSTQVSPGIGKWIEQVAERGLVPQEGEAVLQPRRLEEEDLAAIGADLEGMREASMEIASVVGGLSRARPSATRLQEALDKLRSDVEAITYHWVDVESRLRVRGAYRSHEPETPPETAPERVEGVQEEVSSGRT